MTGDPATVEVRLDGGRSYQIVVGSGLLERAGELIAPLVRSRRAVLVSDHNLEASGQLARLDEGLRAGGIAAQHHLVPAGEGSKSLDALAGLLDSILETGIERSTPVIACGGGVVGDLGGFVAAILMRGLDYIQIPTTLLAQVDSAVGGKTGVNTRHGKNLVGSFHQPRLVLADLDSLETLPPRELRAGYAEVVKYGLIDRPDFFAWLEDRGPALLAGDRAAREHAVVESCRAKADIVADDEREHGRRALLNLGHTFGHALERIAGYGDALLHGEAVAVGAVLAFALSHRLGLCPEADVARLRSHLQAVGLPDRRAALDGGPYPTDAILEAMKLDKKTRDGQPRFVLVHGIGRAVSDVPVEPADLRAALDARDP